ncbi:MAG: MMPL family transporter [Polyangiaceae bacterium]|nr:MMPL family transporter [Polyangiaceae bacterium]
MASDPPRHLIDRVFVGYTLAAARAPWRVLMVALVLLLACVLLAARLEIHGSFVHLLPTWDPTAQRYNGTLARKGGSGASVEVVVESPDPAQNRRFIDALEGRVRLLPPEIVTRVDHGPEEVRAFYREWRWLFVPERDLALVECELGKARAAAAPGFVDIDDPCEVQITEEYGPGVAESLPGVASQGAPAAASAASPSNEPPLRRFEREAQARVAKIDRFPTGYYQNREGTRFLLMVSAPGAGMGELSSDELVRRLDVIIAELAPSTFHPALTVGLSGSIPNAIAEREALIQDIWMVAVLGVALILTSIVVYFRSATSLLHLGFSTAVGTALAFAIAALAYGHLNAATSFLISIVAGNGINYGIMYLARYRERRTAGDAMEAAIVEAALAVRNGTWLASLAAGGAYGCLLVTSFRGFSEFGLIGGFGMVASWVAAFLIMPASISAVDQIGTGWRKSGTSPTLRKNAGFGGDIAAWVGRTAPGTVVAVAFILAIAAVVRLPSYLTDPWEYNFSRLTSRSSKRSGAGAWSDKATEVTGVRGSPVLLLVDDMSQALSVAEQVEKADVELGGDRYVERVETIYDYLGGAPATVAKKLELLAEIRTHIDAVRRRLEGDDARIADDWRPPERLRPLEAEDLPPLLRELWGERDGRTGTPVFAYLARGVSQSNGANILAITSILEAVKLPDGRIVPNASRATIFAAVIRSIARDAPRATFAALLLIVALTVLVTRRVVASASVLGSVLLATLLTVGGAAWLGVRLNFLNFIAIPLTLGLGVEYAINVFERIRVQSGDVAAGVESAGGAVFLCSLCTIIGYGALLIADSPALQSFGKYAIAGEFATTTAAVVVMPAVLHAVRRVWRRPRPSA